MISCEVGNTPFVFEPRNDDVKLFQLSGNDIKRTNLNSLSLMTLSIKCKSSCIPQSFKM